MAACSGGLYFVVCERGLTQLIIACVGAGEDAAAELAINLHCNFNFFFTRNIDAELWPLCS